MGFQAVCDIPIHLSAIVKAATECLQNSPYQPVKKVLCECSHGILILRGNVSTFYQKQVAQEAVARVNGVTQVRNDIQVG